MKTVEQVTSQPLDSITKENAQAFVTVGGQLAEITSNTELAVKKCVDQLKPYVSQRDGKKYIPYTVWSTFRERLLNGYNAVAPWGNDDEKRSVQKGTISPFVGKVKNVLGIEDPKSENTKSEQRDINRKVESARIEKLANDHTLEELETKANEQMGLAQKSPPKSDARNKASKKAREYESAYGKKQSMLANVLTELAKPFSKEVTNNKKELTDVSKLVGMLCVSNRKMVGSLHLVDTYGWVEKNKNYPAFQKEMNEWLDAMPSFAKQILQTRQK